MTDIDFILLVQTIVRIAAILIGATVLYALFDVIVRKASSSAKRRYADDGEQDQRFQTVVSLARALSSAVLFFIAGSMILNVLNVDIAPLLTGAGIVGVMASLSAQSIVKDILAGLFILIERQYAVGMKVTLCGVDGVVESLSLRTTILRDVNGNRIIVPNGSIGVVHVNKEKDKKSARI